MYLSLYCKGSKRVTQGLRVRGSWRPNRSAIYWPPILMAVCVVSSPGLFNRRPRGSALCWMMAFFIASYHQLVSKNSIGGPEGPFGRVFSTTSYQQLLWTPTQSGAPRALSAWCGFPYHISSLTPTVWLPVLTELYNSSTSTQSPTQSLEWHVWSSSSGNNCHTVHRSLSSGASVYKCTMGIFTLSHFVSQVHLRDFSS